MTTVVWGATDILSIFQPTDPLNFEYSVVQKNSHYDL